MPVQFAGSSQADLTFLLALWHELMSAWHPEIAKPMEAPMRRRHAMESLARLLRADGRTEAPSEIAERACGFDIVLRLASGQINMMHATNQFFQRADNSQWFTRIPMPGTGFAGVQLTDVALAEWARATGDERGRALADARRLLESDIESGGIIVRLLPRQGPAQATAAALEDATDRTGYLRSLVRDIHAQPFQPVYRTRPSGQPVTGWDARLLAYFWPAPHQGYRETCVAMQTLTESSGQLAQALTKRGAWSEAEQIQAVELAHAVFKWGGVPQDPDTVTASTVQAVYEAALRDDPAAQANMNSGWTKVAAFATAHLEESDDGRPQVIWDSRVATAIVGRLERGIPAHVDIAALFPGVGTVPGRGGTRPRQLVRNWPAGYGSWRGQVAGSQIVREIRDILNEDGYSLPQCNGRPRRWTTRDVEMVLFMDGY
jgi:hypothetical protein